MYVLGIDAGGTKTIALLADEQGTVIGQARAGGANLQADGELHVEKVLHRVMEEALGERREPPAAIGLGMAGVDRDEDRAILIEVMRRIGYKARTLVVNDALIALVAGVGDEPGIAIVAGTGSIAYGRNARGHAARAGGWGYVLGDEGSGYWIGRHALRAVLRHADGRGPETALTPKILEHFDVARPQDLIHQVYYGSPRPSAIAVLASYVQRAADEGDRASREILERGSAELAQCAASVARRLGMENERCTFVLAGGMFRVVPRLAARIAEHLASLAPSARAEVLAVEPAVGAVRLAWAEARGSLRLPAYDAM
jgi:N-acetylglucosamine kinase-like BadF-type ATPase